jgi:hypothetical protein
MLARTYIFRSGGGGSETLAGPFQASRFLGPHHRPAGSASTLATTKINSRDDGIPVMQQDPAKLAVKIKRRD